MRDRLFVLRRLASVLALFSSMVFTLPLFVIPAQAAVEVHLTGVPDYAWYFGCMGTASGNLMGYWDRHGMQDFYTGPVNGGVAPLNNSSGNYGIVSMWASQAGVGGRPANQPGHVDDYYVTYQDTGPDPYALAGRAEHTPDCIGDFIGLNQRKWSNLGDECNGNIDGYCFVYWDTNGNKRVDFTPTDDTGAPVPDVQSGLRAWTQYRGYDADVFTQLTDFNPDKPAGVGFTFQDLRSEIDAGYPVLLFLQTYGQFSRTVGSATNVNPEIHSMLAYGYQTNDTGGNYVRYMTSWASGPSIFSAWGSQAWQAYLPVRGVIGYHPLPKIRSATMSSGSLFLQWDGPASDLYSSVSAQTNRVHGYVVEMSQTLSPWNGSDVSAVLTTNAYTLTGAPTPAFFRLRLVKP